MSLLYYEDRFSHLNPNRSGGRASPHKIAMMLAVMDLIESEAIVENRILFGDELLAAFLRRFNELKSDADVHNPHLPLYHLQSEGFWHIKTIPGKAESWQRLSTAGSPKIIHEHVLYAYLDDELFELLRNALVRDLLRAALHQNLEITEEFRRRSLNVDGWDWLECEACVADYFAMLSKEFQGEKYSKTQHRNALLGKLNNRSHGAMEFKHQNVSAVLIELGLPYISGYKPMYNYQTQLRDVVITHLAANQDDIGQFSAVREFSIPYITNWDHVLDLELPERLPSINRPDRKFIGRMVNFTHEEAKNRRLGESGEQFVIEFEQNRLRRAGRSDLAKEVEWSSKERGDGLGYDVRSFRVDEKVAKVDELFIEVKTTSCGKYQPFYVTDNELAFSKKFVDNYQLFRVYDFRAKARIFQLTGALDEYVNLHPTLFRASFGQA